MKASELSSYITPGVDVQNGDIVTIASGGEAQKFDDGSQRLQLSLELPSGRTKLFTVNNTSLKALQEKYGDETDEWVDKKASVAITTQNVRGAMKKVIYLSPIQ